MDEAKKQEKAKEITEDELKVLEKDIQKATDEAVKHIDANRQLTKKKELLEVLIKKEGMGWTFHLLL